MHAILETMYQETEVIRAEIEFSNDVAMAQTMFRLHEEGLDPSHLGHGHPVRVSLFNRMVDQGHEMVTRDAIRMLVN